MKPNIVLVHGAWADGSMWSEVIRKLQAEDYYVTAVQNPLTSLADDVATTRRTIEAQNGPTVLVGHSYGGMVITNAAVQNDQVAALVYITAMAPDLGESPRFLLNSFGSTAGDQAPDKNGFLILPRDSFAAGFVPGYDPAAAAVFAATQKPTAVQCLTDKSGEPAWKSTPVWYQIAEKDTLIPPAGQKMMAERMNATISSVDAPHGSLIMKPAEVTEVIIEAANSVSG
ncbi:alpha/beta fold hydrolase [Psychromicrobium sp. YIM B11713]|uniref:alpha/beta fold hydrolase n=1 Tax=Psychromicrobium sp. YIM B11713 TaxID=3145233 RepID=UPI00374F7543